MKSSLTVVCPIPFSRSRRALAGRHPLNGRETTT
jgi:hypothetical protein